MTYGNPSSFGVYNNSLLRIIIDLSGRICSNYSFLNFSKYSRKYGLPSTMLKLVWVGTCQGFHVLLACQPPFRVDDLGWTMPRKVQLASASLTGAGIKSKSSVLLGGMGVLSNGGFEFK